MKIINLFETIKEKLENFKPPKKQENKGKVKNKRNSLEKRVKNILKEYCNILDKKEYEDILRYIKKDDYKYKDDIDKINSGRISFIYQPFGSQQFPDFIIFYKKDHKQKYILFEAKYTKGQKPQWNCSLPKPYKHCMYILVGKCGIVFIQGKNIILKDLYKSLQNIDAHLKQKAIKLQAELDIETEYPFDLYPRPMYNQLFPLSKLYKNRKQYFKDIIKYLS